MSTKEIDPGAAKKANDDARSKGGGPNGSSGTSYAGKSLAEQQVKNQDVTHNVRLSPNKKRIVQPNLKDESLVVVERNGETHSIKGLPLDQDLMFDPDGKKLAYLQVLDATSPREVGIKLVDVGTPDAQAKVLYRTANMLRGLEWSPKGDALYFLEGEDLPNGSQVWYLKRVKTSGVGATIIAKSYTFIDFFQPPVSRFENGQGSSNGAYRVLYGSSDGLYLVSPDGRGKERITEVPASGVDNLEWCPTDDMILVTYKIPRIAAEKVYRGIMLFRRGEKEWEATSLYPDFDVHTLWWSADGRYACFGTYDAVFVYDTKEKDPDKAMRRLVVPPPEQPLPPEEGVPPPPPPSRKIRSFYWAKECDRMVIAAGNCIFLWRPSKPEEMELVHEEGDPYAIFLADAYIMEDGKIVFTAFKDNEYKPPTPPKKK